MKYLLLGITLLMTNCSTLVGTNIPRVNAQLDNCCPLVESNQPISFSTMKTCTKSADNLYDIFAVETVSGKPERKVEMHLFKDKAGSTWLERCQGDGKIETIALKDTAITKTIRALENKHFYQLCTSYKSTVSILNVFEYKLHGKSIFTYSLDGSGLESVCDSDKEKIFFGNQIFQFLKTKQ